jgi:hypothetical protein
MKNQKDKLGFICEVSEPSLGEGSLTSTSNKNLPFSPTVSDTVSLNPMKFVLDRMKKMW